MLPAWGWAAAPASKRASCAGQALPCCTVCSHQPAACCWNHRHCKRQAELGIGDRSSASYLPLPHAQKLCAPAKQNILLGSWRLRSCDIVRILPPAASTAFLFHPNRCCYRQAELGIRDCGGLRLIPGMTNLTHSCCPCLMHISAYTLRLLCNHNGGFLMTAVMQQCNKPCHLLPLLLVFFMSTGTATARQSWALGTAAACGSSQA